MLHWLSELAAPWNSLFADSALVSTGVLFLHLAAIVVAAGTAIAADSRALRTSRVPEMQAQYLAGAGSVHRIVVLALIVVAFAGVLLFLSDVEEFSGSIVFRVKLLLILLLLANGFAITRIETRLRTAPDHSSTSAGWRWLRVSARASQTLWFATLLAGVALRNIS